MVWRVLSELVYDQAVVSIRGVREFLRPTHPQCDHRCENPAAHQKMDPRCGHLGFYRTAVIYRAQRACTNPHRCSDDERAVGIGFCAIARAVAWHG